MKEKCIEQFRETMKFIMKNEILFTNGISPKVFALLTDDGNLNNTSIGMRALYINEPENHIKNLNEGITKISITTDHIENFKNTVVDDGFSLLSLCVIDVFEIIGDASYVFTMYNNFYDNTTQQFDKEIEIHKLMLGQTEIGENGEMSEKKSKIIFNYE